MPRPQAFALLGRVYRVSYRAPTGGLVQYCWGREPYKSDVDFRGEERKNDSHASTTDPEARLARKGPGKEAKLCFAGHVLMENRNGLAVGVFVTEATGRAERRAAGNLISRRPVGLAIISPRQASSIRTPRSFGEPRRS